MPRKPTRAKGLGVDQAVYDRMLAEQHGVCRICGRPPKVRRLHVDHDHKTGAVRGLLCFRCNRLIPTYLTAQRALDVAAYLADFDSLEPDGAPRA